MNLPPYVQAAITEISQNEWRKLFFLFRQRELEKVENSSKEDLTNIQIRVKFLREMENHFIQAYANKQKH